MTLSAARLATLVGDVPLRSPAYRDLTDRIRVHIIDGRLPDGTRLPSERELAAALGVSRTTTTRVYAELRDAGLVTSRQGSGSVVQVPYASSAISSLILDPESPNDIAMTYAAPSASAGLASVFTAAAERLPAVLATTGYLPDGLSELREAIADHHTADGLPTTPDQIVVTCGAMGAINLTAETFLSPGSRVIVEGLSFPYGHDAMAAAGARLSPLPVTDDSGATSRRTSSPTSTTPLARSCPMPTAAPGRACSSGTTSCRSSTRHCGRSTSTTSSCRRRSPRTTHGPSRSARCPRPTGAACASVGRASRSRG